MAVDIGSEAIDRNTYSWAGNTYVSFNNPAEISGEITSIDIRANQTITGLRVGTFYATNGSTFKCRDSFAIAGTITASSKVTKAVSIAIEIGDYIGCYCSEGKVERSSSGYIKLYEKIGEFIDPGDEASYSSYASHTLSLGGYIGVAATDVEITVPLADTINGAVIAPAIALDVKLRAPLGTIDVVGLGITRILNAILTVPLATVDATVLAVLYVGELRILVITSALSDGFPNACHFCTVNLITAPALSKALLIKNTKVRK